LGQAGAPLTGSLPTGGSGQYSYQWESSLDSLLWNNVGGGTQSGLNPGTPVATIYFRRIVTAPPCAPHTSQVITVTVNAGLSNNLIGGDQTLCTGSSPMLITGTIPSGGSGVYTYQWLSSGTPAGPWSIIPGETQTQFQGPVLTQTVYYRRFVNGFPCLDTSAVLSVIVNPVLGNNTILGAQTICFGNTPSQLTGSAPTGGNGVYLYTWESSTDQISWNPLSGATVQSLTGPSLTLNTYFRRIVSAGPCPPITSNVLFVKVDSLIGDNTILSDQTICANQTPATFTGSLPSGGNGFYSYTWQSSPDNILWNMIPGGSSQNLQSNALVLTTYFRRLVSGGVCTPSTSTPLRVTVHPVIGNNTLLQNQTICQGTAPALISGALPSGGNSNYVYQWSSSPDNLAWSNLTGETAQDLNPGILNSSVYYRREIGSGPCSNTSASVYITVHPVLGNNVIGTDQTICTGQIPAPLTGLVPSGGSGQYTYLWESSNDSTIWTSMIGTNTTGYVPGVLTQTLYLRRVVSGGPCTPHTSFNVTITVNSAIVNNVIGSSQTICTGSAPVSFTGTVPMGGSGIYAYQWLSSNNLAGPWVNIAGETLTGYASGTLTQSTYFRRFVVAGPCTDTSTVVSVIVNPLLGNNSISTTQTICAGTAPSPFTGRSPSGGNGVYFYQWESSTDSLTWNPIANGTQQNYTEGILTQTLYYRRIVTAGPCPSITSNGIRITVDPLIGNNLIGTDQTICFGFTPIGLTGSMPTGGNGTYTFGWQSSLNQITWNTITGANTLDYAPGALTQSIYYRRVINAGVCTPSTSNEVLIFVEPPIGLNVISADQTICNGSVPNLLNGSLPTGGNSTYAFQWQSSSNNLNWTDIIGETNQDYISGILINTVYYRRYVNSGTCSDTSNVVRVIVNPDIGNNFIGSDQTLCQTQIVALLNGTVPTGGNGLYTYQWETSTDSLNWASTSGGTNLNYNFGVITTSLYFRRVVSSLPCPPHTSNAVFVLVYPLIGNNSITADETICTGSAPAPFQGSFPTGGTAIYLYQWQSSTTPLGPWINIPGETGQDYASGALTATAYFRREVSSLPCTNISNVIGVLVNPVIGNNQISTNQTICQTFAFLPLNGTLPTGGNNVYLYDWQSSTDQVSWTSMGIGSQNLPAQSPSTNTYYRRVVSAGICPAHTSNTVSIWVEPTPGNNIIGNEQTICSGWVPLLLTGSVPTGGTGIYSYSWESAALPAPLNWLPITGVSGQNYQPATLTQTTYYRRRVATGICPAFVSNDIIVWVDPVIGNNIVGADQTICSGTQPAILTGSLPTGGNNTYTYQWQVSLNNVAWANIPGEINAAMLPPVLTQHTYFRRIAFAGVCDPSTSSVIRITVNDNITNNLITANQTICFNQNPAVLTGTLPSGGGGIYTYQWQSSTDQILWNTITPSNVQSLSGPPLTQTTWFRRIVSGGICPSVTSQVLQVTVLDPVGNNIISANQTICAGQNAATLTGLIPTGGTSLYTFRWESSTDAVNWLQIFGVTTPNYTPTQPSASVYFRRVAVSGPCTDNSNAIQIRVNPVPVLTAGDAAICIGQSATLTASASVGGGVFTWNVPPFNTNTVTVTPNTTTTYSVDYTAGGCAANSVNPVVTVFQLPQAGITHSDSVIFCFGSNVILTANPAGANYQWNQIGGAALGSAQSLVIGSSGSYRLVVTDGNGCLAADTITLTQRSQILAIASGTYATCFGGNDGSATVTANGGTPPYTYAWSNGMTGQSITGLNAGTYQVVVTDDLGCNQTAIVNLINPAAVSGAITNIVSLKCFGDINGAATVSAIGGTPPYTYAWTTSPAQITPTATGLAAGSYTVLITDRKGCFTTVGVQITQPVNALGASIIPPPGKCPGSSGLLSATALGGTPPYTYSWNPTAGLSNPTAPNTTVQYVISTSYSVVVKDANGCTALAKELVQVFPAADARFDVLYSSEDSIIYDGEELTLDNLSQPPGSSWIWTFGDGNGASEFEPTHTYQNEGIYPVQLIVITANGCLDTANAKVEFRKFPKIYVPTAFSPNGDGINDFFQVAYINLKDFNVFIYDRWGNKLYQNQDPKFRWNGTVNGSVLPEGVYTVYIKGRGSNNEDINYSGTVTLIR
jgi:gliding motility-associated-like protein